MSAVLAVDIGGTKFSLAAFQDERNPACDLEVDGDIDSFTVRAASDAGATVFVAGSAVFGRPQGAAAGVRSLLAKLDR